MNLFPHVDWSRNANIYEVNVRQYTPEGTLNAMATHLPRLQKMGVSILWFMPIQPIGRLKRKGSLGSYYAISDYTAVNPEFGTLADFQSLVQQAHALGMGLDVSVFEVEIPQPVTPFGDLVLDIPDLVRRAEAHSRDGAQNATSGLLLATAFHARR